MGITCRALLNGQSDDINKMRICNGFCKIYIYIYIYICVCDFFQLNLETSQAGKKTLFYLNLPDNHKPGLSKYMAS